MANKKTHPLIEPFLMLNNSDGCYRVLLSRIVYCGSYNSSTVFHTADKQKIVVAKSILCYEQALKNYGFVRVHYSALINTAYLCHISKSDDGNEIILTDGSKLIISRPRKNEVINILQKWSIEGKPKLQVNPQKRQVNPQKRQESHKPSLERLMLTF